MPSLLGPPRQSPREPWRWALLPLSLAGHGVGAALLVALTSLTAAPRPPKPPERRPVTMRRLDSRQWAANRGARAAPRPERPAPPDPQGQVVDVAPGNDRAPVESKYVAETNNQVKNETRAREQSRTWSRATPRTQENPELQPSAKGAVAESSAPPASAVSLTQSLLGRRTLPSLLPELSSGTGSSEPSTEPVGTESGSEASGSDTTEGGGAPNDALDVPEGDGTFLNTREWKYAAFFNRVKQAVSAKWDPNGRLRRRNEGLGSATRITVMHVSLRPDDSLADLYVGQSSGVDVLDAEAMSAFEKAAPFGNPPAGLVKDGFVRFTFGFHVTNEGLAAPSPFRFR